MFYSLELEKKLLGHLVMDGSMISSVAEDLFYREVNRQIFREIDRQYAESQCCSIDVVAENVPNAVASYLASMLDGLQNTSKEGVMAIVGKLAELKGKRRLWYASMQMQKSLEHGDTDAVEAIIDQLSSGDIKEGDNNSLTVSDLLNSLEEYKSLGGGVSLGIEPLDNITEGIAGGEVAYILARAKVGKSILMQNILRHFTREYPTDGAIFFSLEMSAPQLAERMLMIELDKNKHEIDEMNAEEKEELINRHRNVFYITRPTMSISDIRKEIISLKFRSNIRLVIIDFLTRLRMEQAGEYDGLRVTTKAIKDMAKELNVAIVVIAQTGRADGQGGYVPLKLESARGSGTIEEDADFIFGIYRPELDPFLSAMERQRVEGKYVFQMLGSRRTELIPRINLVFNKKNLRLHSEFEKPFFPTETAEEEE